jgi:hypothetical protein
MPATAIGFPALVTAGTEVSILISDDTARQLAAGFKPVTAGRYKLQGRVSGIEVFKFA